MNGVEELRTLAQNGHLPAIRNEKMEGNDHPKELELYPVEMSSVFPSIRCT